MPVTPIVAPALFDQLIDYANTVESEKETSSEPTDFCDQFYAQFFQNRMKQEILGFNKIAKEAAVKLRLKVETSAPTEVVLLITWFERYCDVRNDTFSEEYGVGPGEALAELQNYVETLLGRITDWAKLEELADVEAESIKALAALQHAWDLVAQ